METGYVEGMLDRDQRTAKLAIFDGRTVIRTRPRPVDIVDSARPDRNHVDVSHRHPSLPGRTSPPRPPPRRTSRSWDTGKSLSHRLYESLTVTLVYLSVCGSIPFSLAAPANSRMADSRMKSEPKWINPCGVTFPDREVKNLIPDADLLKSIVEMAGIALDAASSFKEEYTMKTFSQPYKEEELNMRELRYDWLISKNFPRSLGEEIPESELRNLQPQTFLIEIYEYLEKAAIGLEQIVWDLEDERNSFHDRFYKMEFQLKSVMCEVQTAVDDAHLEYPTIFSRDIMPENIRKQQHVAPRNIRDFIIYRDYMIMLDYTIQVLNYFIKNQKDYQM